MEKKINILEVNNVDLPGRRFNGYDLMNSIEDENININQTVIFKQSKNDKVKQILLNYEQMQMLEKLENFEKQELSVHSNLSITSPALLKTKEYEEADIIHFHMFHNTKLSLISLLQMCSEKRVVMSFHDPWSITGRCVHFGECTKWQTGCVDCKNLDTLFQFKEDNCNEMWKLKKMIYEKINPDIVVSSKYMYNLVKQSPLTKHFTNVHIIPLGVDLKFFNNQIQKTEARKKFNIPETDIVLFLRAQKALKGTEYVLEALKKLHTDRKITILTCDEKDRFAEIKDRYNVIDFGQMNNKDLLYAYNACDIFLMPSTGETFGMMAIEAMACSKPVIIFNNTALPDVTFAPECGVLVENKNSDKLMEAIEQLITNEEEREKRGKLGRKLCEEHYSIDKYNRSLINLYKEIKEKRTIEKVMDLTQIESNTKASKQIQNRLNKFTMANFKETSEEYKILKYKNIDNTDNIDEKTIYADWNVQKIINEYNNKLYDVIVNKRTHNLFIQIKNAMILLIKDRSRLKNSIQYKFNTIFKKKD